MMAWVRMLAGAFAALLVGAVVGEIPPLPEWFAAVDARRTLWLVATGGGAALGLVLMMGGIIDLVMSEGREIDHDGAEDVERSVRMAARPAAWRATSYRVWGQASGREASGEFTIGAMKAAWRSGAWRREGAWRRNYVTAIGALLVASGLFGLTFTLGPPPIKVLSGGALLYGLAMVGRAFWKA